MYRRRRKHQNVGSDVGSERRDLFVLQRFAAMDIVHTLVSILSGEKSVLGLTVTGL